MIIEDEDEDRSSTQSFDVDPNTKNYEASPSSNSLIDEKSSISNLSSLSEKKLLLRGPDQSYAYGMKTYLFSYLPFGQAKKTAILVLVWITHGKREAKAVPCRHPQRRK